MHTAKIIYTFWGLIVRGSGYNTNMDNNEIPEHINEIIKLELDPRRRDYYNRLANAKPGELVSDPDRPIEEILKDMAEAKAIIDMYPHPAILIIMSGLFLTGLITITLQAIS